jgi:hypothetical protein
MHPHVPATHDPVQQSPPSLHVAPMIAQLEGVWHLSGFPAHVPAQHSSLVAHDAPSAMQADVHTAMPCGLAVHEPLQHVSEVSHGAPRGRHGPGPKSQRLLTGSQLPQQGGTDAFVQISPVARHTVAASVHTPSVVSHSPEQQSLSRVHVVPAVEHSVEPHVPLLQPREQQSEAEVHGEPSMRQ